MRKTVIAILFLLALPGSAASENISERGKAIYDKRCSWCHGKEGMGDGPAAEFLNPPPRDFTMGVYKWRSTPFDEIAPSDEDFVKMIKGAASHEGMPGWTGMNDTSMDGWGDMLSDGGIKDLIIYIKGFGQLEKAEKASIDLSNIVKPSKESIERGKELFKDRCSECHGEEGRGDGRKRLKDDWGARTWPRDLTKSWTFRAGAGAKDIYARASVGIPGTQMPSFADPKSNKKMTDAERWDAANYVTSLNEPYKRPGADTVIKSVRVEGNLPEAPEDEKWKKAEYSSFYLFPQIIAGDKLFKPTLNSVSIKSLYNDSEIAVLMEWDDPTMSVPGDEKAIELAGGEVFPDGAAVQFPAEMDEKARPYFGMGDSRPVNIWFWRSEAGAGLPQTLKVMDAKGFKNISGRGPAEIGLSAKGAYDKGAWRVVFKRPVKTDGDKDIRFVEDKFIPIAFAAWDGSNQDKGSRHTLTGWQSIILERKTGGGYMWAIITALMVFGAELLWLKSAKKR